MVRNMSRNSSIDGVKGIAPKRGMVLPFAPLAMSFDDVNYYVDMPPVSLICFFTIFSFIFSPIPRNFILLFFLVIEAHSHSTSSTF